MAKLFKPLMIAGAVAVVAVGGWLALRPIPVPVDLAEVTQGPMEVTVNAEGVTRIHNLYHISSPVSGLVLRSPVEVGDPVVAGKTLVAAVEPGEPAFLDERSRLQAEAAVKEAAAALKLAEANIAAARSALDYSEAQMARYQRLYDNGNLSAQEYQRQRADLETKKAQLAAAEAERDLRQSTLERQRATLTGPQVPEAGDDLTDCCIRLTAPVSGQVLSVVNTSQRMVAAGEALLTVGDPKELEVSVDLLSSDAVRLKAGATATVDRWGGDGLLQAKLREIEPSGFTKVSALGIEEQRVKAILDFTGPPARRAGLGNAYRVYVRIVEWQAPDAVQVPIGALFREGADWAVYVDGSGVARKRVIKLGRRNDEVAQVLDGLKPGDEVITHPSDRVAEGVQVTPR
ncbi:efflux RND transporter periplasmic adaptor subunit [Acidimangrovimonas pyrenivorans]|uniref:Efflux RND transporter periplasmic adaptor subunit n=1 Tax=Acidimangrovimonas pyrenivorans TaxID=2030798 RepID=A0ABV7AL00_9RHOB